MPTVSLIIRCYNEERHIGRLLCGVLQQRMPPDEIILVDSGSTDATLSLASRYPVKIVEINKDEFSFGRSLNVGCGASAGDLLVFASAHVYPVHRDWLQRLLVPFENEQVALVYGRQLGNEVTRFSERQIFARWFPDYSDWNQGHPFCNNANAAIRRSLWERFPYDESLTGLEDLAWAQRVRGAGFRIAYEACAEVVHIHEESPKVIFSRYRREAIALKDIEPQQSFSLLDFLRLYAGNVFSDLRHAARQGELLKSASDITMFRLMQFWGTYRGFRHQGLVTGQLRRKFYYPQELSDMKDEEPSTSEQRQVIDYSHIQQ